MSVISGVQKTYLETAKKALDNSNLWLNEANYLLFEKKNYGHSCALSIFSIEEAAKAYVCFAVTIGTTNPEDEIVETVFKDHHYKMAILLDVVLHLFVPQLTKMYSKLEEEDVGEVAELYQQINSRLEEPIENLVKLRMKAMYVDLINGEIAGPESILQGEAEGIFMVALFWNRLVQSGINTYQFASEEEKMRRIELGKKIATQFKENLKKVRNS